MSKETEILDRLANMEWIKVPTGADSFAMDITTKVKEYKPNRPWISFIITNDGSDPVRLRVNNLDANIDDQAPINTGETLNYDFTFPVIKKLYIVSEGSSSVRIFGIEGREWS